MKISSIAKLNIFLVLIMSISCNTNNQVISIKKTIKPINNSNISGTISLQTSSQVNDSVYLEAHVYGLDPGTKAIHIHEFGDCSSDDGLSTGGHWNPTDTKHGKWGDPTGFHLGAIGNFQVDSIGHGMLKFGTDLWCLGCGEKNDIMSKAIIIHNGQDDYISQPSGASGMRIGCMEINIQE
ncbi:MAG: superoxide dismutase family protein [Candidatus Marisimplicoccus sp.]|nr:MAG: Superoxide dismutase-like protein YojM [Flavobacteriales bacterium]|tara:strand:+ start:1231 stop:1773 length:543 start_codon:yes stop_codon:yes gene_type:complete